MRNLKIIIPTVLITLVVAVVLYGNFSNDNIDKQAQTVESNNRPNKVQSSNKNDDINKSTSKTKELSLVEHKAEISGNYIYIKGSVKNNAPYPISFIKLKVTFTDENGEVINTNTGYVNDSTALNQDEQKSFSIMTEMINPSEYKDYHIELEDYKK